MTLVAPLLQITLWLFGISFFVRNTVETLNNNSFLIKRLTKIGTALLVIVLSFLCYLFLNSFRGVFAFYFCNLLMFFINKHSVEKTKFVFEQQCVSFLTKLVLKSSCGCDLSACFEFSLQQLAGKNKVEFARIVDFVSFSQQKRHFKYKQSHFVANELSKIKKNSSFQTEKIKKLRNYILLQSKLRQRSRAVTQQMRVQVCLLSLFYMIALTFIFFESTHFDSKVIFLSLFLFILGNTLAAHLGEKRIWKV